MLFSHKPTDELTMTFYTQGLNSHELMPYVRLFNKKTVERTHQTAPKHKIDFGGHPDTDIPDQAHSGIAIQSYHDIEGLPQSSSKLIASQIMSSDVITLNPDDSIDAAIKLFKRKKIRHIPIVKANKIVVGIISERDILHYLSGTTDDYDKQKLTLNNNLEIKKLMKPHVLTASTDTDVRFIARLFVEQHIGAMPIVTDGSLLGIITRSDVLGSVMRNFILELWA